MKEKGFTLVDVISLGFILLILGMIAVPHVKAARSRSREVQVRTNMHTLQLTAEDFATLANGVYPEILATNVQAACGSPCAGDVRHIANAMIPPFDSNSLLPYTFSNPFIHLDNALANTILPAIPGIVAYQSFDITGPAAQGYSIRGYGAIDPLSLLLISSR